LKTAGPEEVAALRKESFKAIERARRQARRELDAEEAAPHDKLKALTLAELFSRPRPGYLIDQWIPEQSMCELVGPPESLKSFFMCHAGLAIASQQREFFGYQVVKHGPVLYIAAEGGGAFQYRVRAWCHAMKVDPLTVPFHVIPLAINLRDESYQRDLLAVVNDLRPVLIVVDTLARSTPGADENSARDMGEVTFFCTDLQNVSGATVVFIHHPTKTDPKGGGRGSGAILGAVDTELRAAARGVQSHDGSRPIEVTCTKQKDDLKPPPLNLVGSVAPVLDLQGLPLKHASGRPITTLVLRLGTAGERVLGAEETLEKRILDYVRENPGKGKSEISVGVAKNKSKVLDMVDQLARAGLLTAEESKEGKTKKRTFKVAEDTGDF
jgi:hypothetical protein